MSWVKVDAATQVFRQAVYCNGFNPAKRRRLHTVHGPPYRALLFGADNFSCSTLRALHEAKNGLLQELTVVVPPDARTGRGLKVIHRPPLRILAEELNVQVISLPKTLLKGWQPPEAFIQQPRSNTNLLLTASFGHLIPSKLLDLFEPLNALNVHPSLLPRYRGAAPIQYTIANGDEVTGVSVQELSRGKFDHGRLLAQQQVAVPPDSRFTTLEPVLAKIGGKLLVQVLQDLPGHQARAWQQDDSQATLAPKIPKDAGRINWSCQSTLDLQRWQRGVGHQAPLHTSIGSRDETTANLQLQLRDSPLNSHRALEAGREPGTAWLDTGTRKLHVACTAEGREFVIVDRVKPAGSKWMEAWEWWNGQGKRVMSADGTVKFQ